MIVGGSNGFLVDDEEEDRRVVLVPVVEMVTDGLGGVCLAAARATSDWTETNHHTSAVRYAPAATRRERFGACSLVACGQPSLLIVNL